MTPPGALAPGDATGAQRRRRSARCPTVTASRRQAHQEPSRLEDRQGDVSLALSEYLPPSVVPATLILDRDGRVAARALGAVEEPTLHALLDTVLAEP